MTDQPSFQAFLDGLAAAFGPDSLGVRHELYFTARRQGRWRSKPGQGAHALGALLKTIIDLMLRPGPRRVTGAPQGLLVASLPGENGWRALRPLHQQAKAAGLRVAALWHPRLGRSAPEDDIAVFWPPRPSFADFGRALRQAWPALHARHPRVGSLAVAATLARGHLWRAAWRRLAAQHPAALALHNDFDLMGAAAAASGLPTLVVQHGTPTDEFFPCRADVQVVWGATSAAAFAAGVPPGTRLLTDGFGRREAAAAPPSVPPDQIVLLSQTHTDIYGGDLPTFLGTWAAAIEARGLPLAIWLHPAEGAAPGPYRQAQAAPHAGLKPGAGAPKLVIGFSTTALLDAVRAGHYVVGLEGDFPGSPAAQTVARPPIRVGHIDAMAALWSDLQNSATARTALATEGQRWIAESFAPTGAACAEWVRMAARCSRS